MSFDNASPEVFPIPHTNLSCFKAYDIRGRVPEDLNPHIAYRIGRAYGEYLVPGQVVVGYDVRLQSPELAAAVSEGLLDIGVSVIDIGWSGKAAGRSAAIRAWIRFVHWPNEAFSQRKHPAAHCSKTAARKPTSAIC